MMQWFDVSGERLCREQEVDTPIDVLPWKYYRYVKEHPFMEEKGGPVVDRWLQEYLQ